MKLGRHETHPGYDQSSKPWQDVGLDRCDWMMLCSCMLLVITLPDPFNRLPFRT